VGSVFFTGDAVVFVLDLRFGAGLGAGREVSALLTVGEFESFGLRMVMFCEFLQL